MPEPVAKRTIVYWPALAPGVAQVEVARFIAVEGSDAVVVVVGNTRQQWGRPQVERVLAAFRQAGYTLEASVEEGTAQARDKVPEDHTDAVPPSPPV